MSGSKNSSVSKKQRSAEIANANPGVDAGQMKEAGALLGKLEREGVERRRYAISSPYDRTGLRHYTRRRS
jgi:hypothetical protein